MNLTSAGIPAGPGASSAAPSPVQPVVIPLPGANLAAALLVPAEAQGLVLQTSASGCIRETHRNQMVARQLEAAGLGTLRFHLLTPAEAEKDVRTGNWSFDLDLLTRRLLQATAWTRAEPRTRALGIGFLGTSTDSAAALLAAAELGGGVQAVVCRSGRPDLAGAALARVTAPTLLIVGEQDAGLLALNRDAYGHLLCRRQLTVVPAAGHLFEEPGALEQVAQLAADWFRAYLRPVGPS